MTLQGKLQNWTWLTALSVVLAGCSSTASKAPVAPEASTAPKRATAPAEAVTWRNVVNCDVSGNTLTKTGVDGWNGGAVSTRILGGDGYAEFTVPASAGFAMMGLTDFWFNDHDAGDYSSISYAFYTYPPTGQLMVFEFGEFRGQFGAYTAGDRLRVAVEAGVVNYYWNGALVYTSDYGSSFGCGAAGESPCPLRVDTALYSLGAVVQDAVLGGAVVDLTQAVTWQYVVSCDVSGNTLTKTGNDGWTGGASSTFGLGGDGYAEFTVPAGAGYAMMGLGFGDDSIDYPDIDYAFYTYPPTGQLNVFENGVFRGQFGAYTAGDKLRVAVEAGVVNYYWNGALVHTGYEPILPLRVKAAIYSIGAAVQTAVLAGTVVDLATTPDYDGMQWGNAVGVAKTSATSRWRAQFPAYPYLFSDVIIKTAPTGWNNAGAVSGTGFGPGYGYATFLVPTIPGYAMFGLSNGDTDQDYPDIDYAFYTYPPTGQLNVFENGEFRGQFGVYTPGDVLTIAVEGGVVHYYSNSVLVYTSTVAPTFPLRIDTAIYSRGTEVEVAIIDGDNLVDFFGDPPMESVAWQNMTGVYWPSNEITLIKTASDGWNAGASSTRGLAGDGYAYFSTEYSAPRFGFAMFGLSNGDASVDYSDIDYAFYTFPFGPDCTTNQLMVFEKGTFRVQFGASCSTPFGMDFLRIAVEGGVVHYYWNGVLVYRSTVAPTFPLRIDTALFSTYARVQANYLVGTLVDVAPAP